MTTTTTGDVIATGFVVGEETEYLVGLQGTVEAIGDGTITIAGFTLPTRLAGETGPVRVLSTMLPTDTGSDLASVDEHDECVSDEEYVSMERYAQRLADGITKLHEENHTGPITVCLHEVCRRADGRR